MNDWDWGAVNQEQKSKTAAKRRIPAAVGTMAMADEFAAGIASQFTR